ncbi:MAG: VCBS repeat-containing protein [Planctomycetes bacterium]|nr:VCBS repeat-containing protein [Planctomycetota bacterium]
MKLAPTPTSLGGLASRSSALLALLAGLSACNKGQHSSSGPGGGGSNPLVVDFDLRSDLHLGSAFLGDLLHADLDGDGLEDLVEANFGTKFLTIAAGEADGTFTTLLELPTLGHGFRLARGDFDGNGREDLAVACGDWIDGADQAVQVFLQGPLAFEFGAPVTLEMDTDPKDLCAAPLSGLSGDAGPDELFVALREEQRVMRLSLSGGALVETGSLDSSALGLGAPYSVCVLDVGGDGILDLVVGEDNPGNDRVLEFPRTVAGFQTPTVLLEPLQKPAVESTGDMDGNGFEDLAIAQFEGSSVVLLAGDAAGLTLGYALDCGGETTSLLFEDLDGDGLAEVMATVFLQESLQVRKGLAPFTWGAPVHYNVGIGPRAIGVLSLPGDAHKDLLCANAQDLSLLYGRGDGSFRCATGAPTGVGRPVLVDSADLDNDGDQDAVVITRNQESLVFLENQAGALETVNVLALQKTPKDDSGFLALADVDVDGDVDAMVTVLEKGELRLYRNQGGPASFAEPLPADVIAVGQGPLGLDLGDLNDDQRIDAVVGLVDEKALRVLLGQGGGAFQLLAPLALTFAPLAILCADFDGDGQLDVAATGRADAGEVVAVFAGDGAGGLTLRGTLPVAFDSGNLSMGDLDENGQLDLVVGQLTVLTDEVLVLLNQGAFAFSATPLRLSAGPGTPLIADADRDGHLDLLVLSTGGELALARGLGTGNFVALTRTAGELPCPDGTVSATLADLDGDGLPELLMVTPEAPFVWSAKNVSQEPVNNLVNRLMNN